VIQTAFENMEKAKDYEKKASNHQRSGSTGADGQDQKEVKDLVKL
jgi:hypothetical protein